VRIIPLSRIRSQLIETFAFYKATGHCPVCFHDGVVKISTVYTVPFFAHSITDTPKHTVQDDVA